MKALTLHQPWASLIALGVKILETRSWATPYRGPLAIHASKDQPCQSAIGDWHVFYHYSAFGEDHWRMAQQGRAPGHRVPLGAVVATCRLVDVVPIIDLVSSEPVTRAYVGEFPHDGDLPHQQGGLWLVGSREDGCGTPTRIEDQRAFGNLDVGNYAWLLADIEPLPSPIPATGHGGLWTWDRE